MRKKKRGQTSRHHRRPRSLGGETDSANISKVRAQQHRAWHLLFENKNPYEIARIINSVWIDPSVKCTVEEV